MKSLHLVNSHPRFGFAIAALLGVLPCGCGYGPSDPSGTTLTAISIIPPSATIVIGATATLTAIGNYSNGSSVDITNVVAWSSDAPATASVVAGTGVVGGNAVGTATITASRSSGGTYSTTISAGSVVTVTAAALSGVTISPLSISINRGATTSFTATGAFSDSTTGNVSGSVNWTTNDPAVATINASGIATGVGVGSCTVTAASGVVSNTATLTVM